MYRVWGSEILTASNMGIEDVRNSKLLHDVQGHSNPSSSGIHNASRRTTATHPLVLPASGLPTYAPGRPVGGCCRAKT